MRDAGRALAPSLKLPDPVTDLSATRTGNQVSLTWTMPKKNTDKLLLKGNIQCASAARRVQEACATAGSLQLAPGADGVFSECCHRLWSLACPARSPTLSS
jgi:hypothetical protein